PSPRRTTSSSSAPSRCFAIASRTSSRRTMRARASWRFSKSVRPGGRGNEPPEAMMSNMRELVAELEARRAKVREMGGPDKIARQHARGKMTARERLAVFFDEGAFVEIGAHGTQMGLAAGADGSDKPAADGVVTAFGKVDGRMVTCAAYDFTVKGGSIGYTGEE